MSEVVQFFDSSQNAAVVRDVFMEMIELLHRYPVEEVLEKGTKCETY